MIAQLSGLSHFHGRRLSDIIYASVLKRLTGKKMLPNDVGAGSRLTTWHSPKSGNLYKKSTSIVSYFFMKTWEKASVAQPAARPASDQQVAGSVPTESGNIILRRLIMTFFKRSFSTLYLAEECAHVLGCVQLNVRGYLQSKPKRSLVAIVFGGG